MREFRHFLLRREGGRESEEGRERLIGTSEVSGRKGRDWALLFALWKQTSNWIADSIGLNKINERVCGGFSAEAAPDGATAP